MHQSPDYNRRLLSAVVYLMASASLPAQVPARTIKVDCSEVLEKMGREIAADPGRLVLAMEDALISSEVCACPIVRRAVNLAGKEPKLISEILVSAIRLMPASAAQITECMLLEAPEAATAIRATLAKELGEKSPDLLTSSEGKSPVVMEPDSKGGKSPVAASPSTFAPAAAEPPPLETESYDDFSYPSVGVNGIYFSSRAVASAPSTSSPQVIIKTITTIKNLPRRPVSPVTGSSPE